MVENFDHGLALLVAFEGVVAVVRSAHHDVARLDVETQAPVVYGVRRGRAVAHPPAAPGRGLRGCHDILRHPHVRGDQGEVAVVVLAGSMHVDVNGRGRRLEKVAVLPLDVGIAQNHGALHGVVPRGAVVQAILVGAGLLLLVVVALPLPLGSVVAEATTVAAPARSVVPPIETFRPGLARRWLARIRILSHQRC